MRRFLLIFIAVTFIIPDQLKAQENEEAVVAGVIAGMVAIGSGIAAIEHMKEQAEYTATQWILSNHPELTSFSLKTLDFDGKKLRDLSLTSVISFRIQEFTPGNKPELNGKKQVLLGITSRGWISEYGIDFNRIQWYLIDSSEWMNIMVAYVKVSSDIDDESYIQSVLKNGKVLDRGVSLNGKLLIPFFKLSGDMYVVTDYSEDMKLLYNEKSLGIFLKETMDLVQIGRGDVIKIHKFLFEEN